MTKVEEHKKNSSHSFIVHEVPSSNVAKKFQYLFSFGHIFHNYKLEKTIRHTLDYEKNTQKNLFYDREKND